MLQTLSDWEIKKLSARGFKQFLVEFWAVLIDLVVKSLMNITGAWIESPVKVPVLINKNILEQSNISPLPPKWNGEKVLSRKSQTYVRCSQWNGEKTLKEDLFRFTEEVLKFLEGSNLCPLPPSGMVNTRLIGTRVALYESIQFDGEKVWCPHEERHSRRVELTSCW